MPKPKLGTGARHAALTAELAATGARSPAALASWIGRKRYGGPAMTKWAAASRKKKAG